MPFNNMNIYF